MDETPLVIPDGAGSPPVWFHVNPLYNLYHYLAKEGQKPFPQRHPATADAAALVGRSRFPRGLHGAWDGWETAITTSATPEDALHRLTAAMTRSAAQIGEALQGAEAVWRDTLWPERVPLLDAAVSLLRDTLAPHFPAMARRQRDLLGLTWPDRVDAHLVTDCYDRFGGYAHPLTIDVTQITGLELCETVIHEATHGGDGWAGPNSQATFCARLQTYLTERGFTRDRAWNVWHAVIFAASGEQIRTFLDPAHVDYARTHTARGGTDLYTWFNAPRLPEQWRAFVSGEMREDALFATLAGVVGGRDRLRTPLGTTDAQS